MNDVLVDALWELAKKEGFTQDQIATVFPIFSENDQINNNVREMPKQKSKS